jgi:hypothetical protein
MQARTSFANPPLLDPHFIRAWVLLTTQLWMVSDETLDHETRLVEQQSQFSVASAEGYNLIEQN